jgi:hypothetical protein
MCVQLTVSPIRIEIVPVRVCACVNVFACVCECVCVSACVRLNKE